MASPKLGRIRSLYLHLSPDFSWRRSVFDRGTSNDLNEDAALFKQSCATSFPPITGCAEFFSHFDSCYGIHVNTFFNALAVCLPSVRVSVSFFLLILYTATSPRGKCRTHSAFCRRANRNTNKLCSHVRLTVIITDGRLSRCSWKQKYPPLR